MSKAPATDPDAAFAEGPLLFYVKNRRRCIAHAFLASIIVAIPIALLSWASWNFAFHGPQWVVLPVGSLAAFFGYNELLLILNTFQLIKPGPAVVISEEGIRDRRLTRGVIRWQEITRMRRGEIMPDRWLLNFYVSQPAELRRKLRVIQMLPSLLRQLLGCGHFTLNFTGLDADADAAVRYVILQLAAHGTDPAFPPIVQNQSGSQLS